MCFDFVAVFCCCVGFTLIWARRREVAGLGSRAACPFLNVLLTSIPEALFLYLDCWCLLDSFLLLFSLSLVFIHLYCCRYCHAFWKMSRGWATTHRIAANHSRRRLEQHHHFFFTGPNPDSFFFRFIIISFHVSSSFPIFRLVWMFSLVQHLALLFSDRRLAPLLYQYNTFDVRLDWPSSHSSLTRTSLFIFLFLRVMFQMAIGGRRMMLWFRWKWKRWGAMARDDVTIQY